jgi:DNA-binding MarR family transcriptional regulator
MQNTVPRPCACTSVKKLSRVLGRIYDAALAVSPMNVTQLAVLRCIDRRRGEPLTHVSKELEMDRTSLYRALNPMIREGWVKVAGGIDARSRTAIITRKGHRLLAEARKHWEQVQTRVVDRFGRSEWMSFVSELERLRQCAEQEKGQQHQGC